MHGLNEIHKPFRKEDGSLLVNECWKTIQGEGPDAGTPAIFVRLTRCNLRCLYCDTFFDTGNWYTPIELVNQILNLAYPKITLVVLTGGEPLLQNLTALVAGCNTAGLRVAIESAGTIWDDRLSYFFKPNRSYHGNGLVISPKTPKLDMGAVEATCALKYIIAADDSDPDDGLPVLSTQIKDQVAKIYRPNPGNKTKIYVQPRDDQDPHKNLLNQKFAAQVAIKYGYRLSLQQHKIVDLP